MSSSFASVVSIGCSMALGGLVLHPAPASAQIYEAVGTRAQGLGGAFVAVADDASATWWNPAGIGVTFFSLVVDRGQTEEPGEAASGPLWRATTGSFAVALPALGLSYYRLRLSEIATGAQEPGRQDPGAAGRGLRALVAHQFGATVGQSVGSHLVIASTLRIVRAGHTWQGGGTLDDADELDVGLETSGDLDVGALAIVGPARLGISVKHVRQPEFGEGPAALVLKRQARAGVAWASTQSSALTAVTAAFDADLTRTPTAFGDARHVAAGVEIALPRQLLAVRGGVSVNTVGEVSQSTSAGGSVALMRGLFVDGAATFGSDRSRKGWAIALRLTI